MFGITWFTTEPHDNPSFESTIELERDLGNSATVFAEYAGNFRAMRIQLTFLTVQCSGA